MGRAGFNLFKGNWLLDPFVNRVQLIARPDEMARAGHRMMMSISDELPTDELERALFLMNLLIVRATGGSGGQDFYVALRREFVGNPHTKALLPVYIRTCRDLEAFWPIAKAMGGTYEARRVQIRADFEPLLTHVEGLSAAPLDTETSEVLRAFSAEGVLVVWQKALQRREQDPEGAITSARTLLESVCKHVLTDADTKFRNGEPLPKLYEKTAKLLNLAPEQHADEVLKSILDGCTGIVGGLGTLRNSFSPAEQL